MTLVVPPYLNVASIAGTETDIYTQSTFEELQNHRKAQKLEYFIAILKDENGVVSQFDGTSYLRNYLKFKKTINPITRAEIKEGALYKICPEDSQFTFFCYLQQLPEDNYARVKYINAADSDLAPKLRGRERSFVAHLFRKEKSTLVARDFAKAKFWWELAAEDGCFIAHFNLGINYAAGLEGFEVSIKKAAFHLAKARNLATDCESQKRIQLSCDEFTQKTGLAISEKVEGSPPQTM